jgi:hypothetical protein
MAYEKNGESVELTAYNKLSLDQMGLTMNFCRNPERSDLTLHSGRSSCESGAWVSTMEQI